MTSKPKHICFFFFLFQNKQPATNKNHNKVRQVQTRYPVKINALNRFKAANRIKQQQQHMSFQLRYTTWIVYHLLVHFVPRIRINLWIYVRYYHKDGRNRNLTYNFWFENEKWSPRARITSTVINLLSVYEMCTAIFVAGKYTISYSRLIFAHLYKWVLFYQLGTHPDVHLISSPTRIVNTVLDIYKYDTANRNANVENEHFAIWTANSVTPTRNLLILFLIEGKIYLSRVHARGLWSKEKRSLHM